MRRFFSWLFKPKPMLMAVLFLFIFGVLLFLLLKFNILSVILFLFMAFGFLGSAATVGKKKKENAVIIIICICAAVLCFLFSIPVFIYEPSEQIKAYEKPAKQVAVFLFVMGIIYVLVAVFAVLRNRRRKNAVLKEFGQPNTYPQK